MLQINAGGVEGESLHPLTQRVRNAADRYHRNSHAAQHASAAEPDREAAAAAIQRLHRQLRWRRRTTLPGLAVHAAGRVLQPLRAGLAAVRGTLTYGRRVAEVTGVSRSRQFLHQWAIGSRFGFDDDSYYRYRMYRLPDVRSAGLFLTLPDNIALRTYVYEQLAVDYDRLADKRRFYRLCIEHDLPAAPTVADFFAGRDTWWPGYTREQLPPCDLFSKQAANIKGRGAARWIWQGDGQYRGEDGSIVTGAELVAHLLECSAATPYILQVRLSNHPRLGTLVPDTLCTVRVVTYRAAGGPARHLASTFKMAGVSSPVDNFSNGGVASPVEPASGRLLRGVLKDLRETVVEHVTHPTTGATIEGFELPDWDRALQLALRAHDVFRELPSVGWDIALTADGPVLVEGNYNWGVAITQQASGRPLGETDYFSTVLSYLDRSSSASSKRQQHT